MEIDTPMVKLLKRIDLSNDIFILKVERPAGFSFKSGQHVTLGIADSGINREYTIYSGEQEKDLSFIVKELPNGVVSTALKKAVPGDLLDMAGPFGEFDIEPFVKQPVFFLASGTGIAPFHSFRVLQSY